MWVCPPTLLGLQDKGSSAENVIEFGRRPSENTRTPRSLWAAGDTLPALTQRVVDLETQLSSLQGELEAERGRLGTYSEFDRTLNDGVADAYRAADAIRSRAQGEASAILERANAQRRLLVEDARRLRAERDALLDEIASLRRDGLRSVATGGEPDEPRPAFDLQEAVAAEMRAMLVVLLEDLRARPVATPAPAASSPEPQPLSALEIEATPPEPSPQIFDAYVEHIEELHENEPAALPAIDLDVLPAEPSQPIVDEYVEELRRPELPLPPIEIDVIPAEPPQPVVNEYVEELRGPNATLEASSELETDVGPGQPPPRIFDEYVEEFAEPAIDSPVVEEDVEELRSPELAPSPAAEIDLDQSPEPSEPIVDEYVEDLRGAEPPAAIANIEVLWESAAPPRPEVEPPVSATLPLVEPAAPVLEPAPFITDEFIAETRPASPLDVDAGPLPPLIDIPPFAETEVPSPIADVVAPAPIEEPVSPPAEIAPAPAVSEEPAVRQIQVLISPVHSFPRLIEIQARIQSLSSVQTLQLRDFRNGVATFAVGIAEAISPHEFGAVIQMLENLHLRLEGTGQNSVELRAEDDGPTA